MSMVEVPWSQEDKGRKRKITRWLRDNGEYIDFIVW